MVTAPIEVDDRPVHGATAVAVLAAGVAAAVLYGRYPTAGLLALLGGASFLVGGQLRTSAMTNLGSAAMVLAVLLAGLDRLPPATVVAVAVLAVVAWDSAANARSLGRHVGRRAGSLRAALAHAGGTLLGGSIAATVALVVFGLTPGGWPAIALVLVVAGGATLLWWLERSVSFSRGPLVPGRR
ncbi:MAG: hypothetical protein ACLFMX_08420 [Halobacteriales archaeon]